MARNKNHITPEQDLRLKLLNTLLTTPHRKLAEVQPVHAEMAASDPRFYVRLAAWYADHGDVRDHKEMFIITLVLSDFEGHRDVGLAMLRELPPYEVVRVLDFINGRKKTRTVRPPVQKGRKVRAAPKQRYVLNPKPGVITRVARLVRGVASEPARIDLPVEPQPVVPEIKLVTDAIGLFRNPPRSLRTEIVRYLREREADADWFDGSVLVARKAIKRLYALNHVKPGARAQRILFEKDPPKDSRLYTLRQIAKAKSPDEQAQAIIDSAIPFRVATTVVKQMTPAVLAALIDRMSSQEVINNIASLTKRGAMKNPALKAAIEQKLDGAKTATRVSALKTGKAITAAGPKASAEMKAKLEGIADAQVKAKGRIDRPTALLIDKSQSMSITIEVGKRIGAMISTVCTRDLFVYAFDSVAFPIEPGGKDLASWEKALAGIHSGGNTSIGAAVEAMRQKEQYVEQIILVTDEEENTPPLFLQALQKYKVAMKADPNLCIVRVPNSTTKIETQCKTAGMVVDLFQFDGDYYSLPNLIPLLSKPSRLDLLMEILDHPLPERKLA